MVTRRIRSSYSLHLNPHASKTPLGQHFLGFRDCLRRIQLLWACLRAIHNRMAAIQPERIFKPVEALTSRLIATVDKPTIRGKQCGRAEIAVTVPPVARAARRATGAQYASGWLVDQFLILFALQAFLVRWWWSAGLQPRLDRGVLRVEIRKIGHKVLDDRHVRQRINPDVTPDTIDRARTRQRIAAINIHCARTANALTAGTTKRQCWIDFVFDLDERVKNHRAAAIEIDIVDVNTRILAAVRIVAIHREPAHVCGAVARVEMLALPDPGIRWKSEFSQLRCL